MSQTKNLTNSTVFRRFLTGEDEPLRNHSGSVTTTVAPDGSVLLEGYGHNLYAERRPNGDIIVYEGTRQWAWDQYPEGKRGKPTTARHIDNLISEADALDVDYSVSDRSLRTAGIPNGAGDLAAIGRLGGSW